ncbi:MAG: peptidase T [Treponemataceae bacterium]|nr:peptidase T [Treponemataceae bacterium]
MTKLPDFSENLLNRFLKYVKVWTTSDSDAADSGLQPSTERQFDLANLLKDEIASLLGSSASIELTQHCYLCIRIPASKGMENIPSIGFLAHMDTSSEAPGQNVNPQIIEDYDGSLEYIGKEGNSDGPESVLGHTIITTDGNTLLGADDKAGIAEILTAIEIIQKEKIPHGQIEIIFSPDEETGHGMDNVPLDWIQSKVCFTIDGGQAGQVEAECFNAWKSEIIFTGKALHTGSARPDMTNAITMACAFLSLLPQNESPEATDQYQGFYAPISIEGAMESAKVSLLLRDFTQEGMERRKSAVDAFAQAIRARFPLGQVEVKHIEQYKNMKEKLDQFPQVMKNLIEAVSRSGIKAELKPIRGGTDGSRLTELGIPTPNVFTGGHNFHSRMEWASLNQMCYTVKTIVELIKIYAEK